MLQEIPEQDKYDKMKEKEFWYLESSVSYS